jgi:3',5'-cyclic AMP phosphodiesterase CpdA
VGEWYDDANQLAQRLAEHGGNAEALARATGVPVGRIKRRRQQAPVAVPRSVDRKPWGLGGPARLALPPKEDDYTGVGLFDLHGEWREQGLFDAALNMVREVEPDFVVIGGDAINFDVISRWHAKILSRMTPLQILRECQRERDDFRDNILAPIREAAGSAVVVMVEGNHDDRLRKYLSDDLREGWEEARRFLQVDEYLDDYYTRAGVFICGHLMSHGEKLSKYPAAAELAAADCSGWSGHGHWANQHFGRPNPLSGRRLAHTRFPAMCRLDANYGSGNAGLMQWHQGCGVGTFSASNVEDHHTDLGFWNGKDLLIRGKRFT